jgi:predicted 3-demethylubiquinone-9 3-methyltransferase (glyoxalase superfamily)
MPFPEGTLFTANFRLFGQQFMEMNAGAPYKFNPAFSILISSDTQDEIDLSWEKLLDGGEEMIYGWLTDKFGRTWQIIPTKLSRLLYSPDKEKSGRVK